MAYYTNSPHMYDDYKFQLNELIVPGTNLTPVINNTKGERKMSIVFTSIKNKYLKKKEKKEQKET